MGEIPIFFVLLLLVEDNVKYGYVRVSTKEQYEDRLWL